MHPAIKALHPHQADSLCAHWLGEQWAKAQGIEWTSELATQLVMRSIEPPEPPPDSPYRKDAGDLRELMTRMPGLPARVREVGTMLLLEGMSLRQVGEKLGIKTSTVRVHLRRLRAARRLADARRAADAQARLEREQWEASLWPTRRGSGGSVGAAPARDDEVEAAGQGLDAVPVPVVDLLAVDLRGREAAATWMGDGEDEAAARDGLGVLDAEGAEGVGVDREVAEGGEELGGEIAAARDRDELEHAVVGASPAA